MLLLLLLLLAAARGSNTTTPLDEYIALPDPTYAYFDTVCGCVLVVSVRQRLRAG